MQKQTRNQSRNGLNSLSTNQVASIPQHVQSSKPNQTHNPSRDGLDNRIEYYVLTHFKGFWDRVQHYPFLRRKINSALINRAISKIPTRPLPLSTMAPYTSWASLTDRTFTARHLPPVAPRMPLPPAKDVAELFRRRKIQTSEKSTVLFSHFAQWFTDGFLRTDIHNCNKNTSPHEIDLCQVYGLHADVTEDLRSKQGGRLKSQLINGEEYPCFYYNQDGTPYEEFKHVPEPLTGDIELSLECKAMLFAMGVERANVQVGYVMMNTLFLREHNRIAGILAAEYPDWTDDQLFQTTRNIVIVLVLKIVIEEYINHIAPYHFKFRLDPTGFPNEKWYRQNWMSVEFSLVYRWHGLVPDALCLGGQSYPLKETLLNNSLLTKGGLGAIFEDSSLQPAGDIHVFNTPHYLLPVEMASIQMGREVQLASYNDYRELAGYPRVTRWSQISGNQEVQRTLKQLYKHVDNIEFYAGLFAEDVRENAAVGSLIGRLVGIDAFSQALTNPLLNPHVYNEKTFTKTGLNIIETTQCLSDILHRNIPWTGRRYKVSLTRLDWRESST